MKTGHQHAFIQSFLNLRRLLPHHTQKAKRAIRTYDGEDNFELLNSHDQEHTPKHLVEFNRS